MALESNPALDIIAETLVDIEGHLKKIAEVFDAMWEKNNG